VLIDEVVNLFSKVAFYGIYDGHGGEKCAGISKFVQLQTIWQEYMVDHLHKNICNQEAFQKGEFEKAIQIGFKKTDEEFLHYCR
jgi:serine/threonine protein phosphatase PrpC